MAALLRLTSRPCLAARAAQFKVAAAHVPLCGPLWPLLQEKKEKKEKKEKEGKEKKEKSGDKKEKSERGRRGRPALAVV